MKNILTKKLWIPLWLYAVALAIESFSPDKTKHFAWLLLLVFLTDNFLLADGKDTKAATAGKWVSYAMKSLWLIGFAASFQP